MTIDALLNFVGNEDFRLSLEVPLKGLAHERARIQPFSAEFIGRYGLGSGSNVQRAVDALLEKDVIDRDKGSFLISDRFFRLWLLHL